MSSTARIPPPERSLARFGEPCDSALAAAARNRPAPVIDKHRDCDAGVEKFDQ